MQQRVAYKGGERRMFLNVVRLCRQLVVQVPHFVSGYVTMTAALENGQN